MKLKAEKHKDENTSREIENECMEKRLNGPKNGLMIKTHKTDKFFGKTMEEKGEREVTENQFQEWNAEDSENVKSKRMEDNIFMLVDFKIQMQAQLPGLEARQMTE